MSVYKILNVRLYMNKDNIMNVTPIYLVKWQIVALEYPTGTEFRKYCMVILHTGFIVFFKAEIQAWICCLFCVADVF